MTPLTTRFAFTESEIRSIWTAPGLDTSRKSVQAPAETAAATTTPTPASLMRGVVITVRSSR
jgi:hypothetical protein